MARRTKEQEQTTEVKSGFPYQQFTTHPAWKVIEDALNKLQANNDLEMRTASAYLVGFIMKELVRQGLSEQMPKSSKESNGHGFKLRSGVINLAEPRSNKSRVRKSVKSRSEKIQL